MPEEQRHVAQWQRLTIYRYTLPPPYEATEHLFEGSRTRGLRINISDLS
jgi:hypothetical protein